ncbi:MAG: 4'-phosphopantetheinyl transferase superfamily protein [Tannerella sp.]|jgi:phosphopantetheinyl transferase|nr:4'-phosphopantetheinyl transferase superfamily protein [Tannerella sp.]
MPILQKSTSPLWGIWKIEEHWADLLARSEQPENYLPFLGNSKSDGRKAEWLAVRLLLKELTGIETGIAYHANGYPFLPDMPFHISISHTKGYAAVLLHADHPAGIDIEYRSERIQRLKSRFLDESEQRLLGENPGTTELLICWSAKETAFKMTKQKTADWQKDFHILACDFASDTGFLTVQETLTPQSASYQIRYDVATEFVITRCD